MPTAYSDVLADFVKQLFVQIYGYVSESARNHSIVWNSSSYSVCVYHYHNRVSVSDTLRVEFHAFLIRRMIEVFNRLFPRYRRKKKTKTKEKKIIT